MNKLEIGFVGEGWGAVAAIKSLKYFFDIHYCSNDENVINELIDLESSIRIYNLDEFNVHHIVFAGYTKIVDNDIILKHNIINIHYSLLPKYRGLHSTAWSIINNEKELGISIHLMNKFIDDGPILFQKAFENDFVSTASDYMLKMNKYIENNLGKILIKYFDGNITPVAQNKKNASWVGKRGEKHNKINFNQNNEFIKRLFRVLNPPYPFPHFYYKNEIYYVHKVEFFSSNIETDISRILNIDDDGVWVKSKDGYVIMKQIFDNKNLEIDLNFFTIGSYLK